MEPSHAAARQHPLVFFGNLVNELMTAAISPAHARTLSATAHRKLWLARPGDLLVIPSKLSDGFRRYACDLLEIETDSISIIHARGPDLEPLAGRLENAETFRKLRTWLNENPNGVVQTFAQDLPTVELLQKLSLPLEGYDKLPSDELLQFIYRLNSKSGFRHLARTLQIPIPYGFECNGTEELVDVLTTHFGRERAIIKFDRSSNGYGNLVVDCGRLGTASQIEELINLNLLAWPEQPRHFVVEEFIEWVAAPSIELDISASGPTELYICDQRCINNAWSGMVTPPQTLSSEATHQLRTIGMLFGRSVWQSGYRGICDVDCLIDRSGRLVATETNFRRTGGTHLDYLARRLLQDDYSANSIWIADVADASSVVTFESAVAQLRSSGLQFDHRAKRGAILTADTLHVDGKWRYMVIASDFDQALEIESALFNVLSV